MMSGTSRSFARKACPANLSVLLAIVSVSGGIVPLPQQSLSR